VLVRGAESRVGACCGVGTNILNAPSAACALSAAEGRTRATPLVAAPPALIVLILDLVGVGGDGRREDTAVLVGAAKGAVPTCCVGRVIPVSAARAAVSAKGRAFAALLAAVPPALLEAVGDIQGHWRRGRRRRRRRCRLKDAAVVIIAATGAEATCCVEQVFPLFAARAPRPAEGRARTALLVAVPPALILRVVQGCLVAEREDAAVVIFAAAEAIPAFFVREAIPLTRPAACALGPAEGA